MQTLWKQIHRSSKLQTSHQGASWIDNATIQISIRQFGNSIEKLHLQALQLKDQAHTEHDHPALEVCAQDLLARVSKDEEWGELEPSSCRELPLPAVQQERGLEKATFDQAAWH